MKISIGGNLKRLRAGKGITQEQLAEVLNVTPQAVSRWENDQAYPDISLLPGLAMYYGVSVDEILGMDGLREEERLHAMMDEIYTLARAGQLEKSIARIRENLRIYPDNSSLLMALGEVLARMDGEEALTEAIAVSERALGKSDVSMKARSTTAVNLIFLYMRAGREQAARELIGSLPHIWESREMVAPEAYEGDLYREELKKAARKALAFLCMKTDGAAARRAGETPGYVQLGVEFENGMRDEEMLRKIGEFLDRD